MPRRTVFVALFFVSACAHVSPTPDQTFNFRPGYGAVQSVREAIVPAPLGKTVDETLRNPLFIEGLQITLRMDDGTTQAITQKTTRLKPGDRAEVTRDGRVVTAMDTPAAGPAGPTGSPYPERPSAGAAGLGTVERVDVPSSSAGASAPPAAPDRLTVRMEDGSTRVILQHEGVYRRGDRVRVTEDGKVVRP